MSAPARSRLARRPRFRPTRSRLAAASRRARSTTPRAPPTLSYQPRRQRHEPRGEHDDRHECRLRADHHVADRPERRRDRHEHARCTRNQSRRRPERPELGRDHERDPDRWPGDGRRHAHFRHDHPGRTTSAGGTVPPSGTPVTTGSLSVSGGTVNVDTLFLGDQNWNLGTVNAVFRLAGGGTLNAGTITTGTGAGSARRSARSSGVTARSPTATRAPTSRLAAASRSRWPAPERIASRSAPAAAARSPACSRVPAARSRKAGDGTLTLSANNTYTGATTIAAGTLIVNGNQSAAVGAVTVDLGATLGGSGTIGGATTVNGILSPGNSPGVLTLAELALGSTSTTLMEITGTARGGEYDGLTITQPGGLGYGGTLSLSLTTTFTDNTTFDLFAFSGLMSGSFSSVTATGSYGSLTFTNDGLGVWSSGPTTVAGQTMTFSQSTGDLVIVPEPAGFVLLAVGASIVFWARRRR